MDALCAVLTPGFKESNWTDQEVGIAIGRGILVIPIRKKLDPYGFIGKYQGFQTHGKKISEVAEGIFEILTKNPKTRLNIINDLIDLFLLSNNEKESLERIRLIKKINDIPSDKINLLNQRIIENQNLKNIFVLNEFNELMKKYQLQEIQMKDFDKVELKGNDYLPF